MELAKLMQDLSGGNAEAAEAAALALPAHGEAAMVELAKLATSKVSEQRWWAVRALAGFKAEPAGALLRAALDDAETSVRQCAALSLSERPEASAIPLLVAMLQSTEGLEARLAGDALVAAGAAAVEPLIAALQAEPLNAKVEAARALALIGDTRAIGPLFQALDTDSAVLEHWISEGLEKMGVGMSFFQP